MNLFFKPVKFLHTLIQKKILNRKIGRYVFQCIVYKLNLMRNIIHGLTDGSFLSPEVFAGVTSFEFTGGTLSQQTFDAMLALYNANKVDPCPLASIATPCWQVAVPVYDWGDCSNPNKDIVIVGFATVYITDVYDAPEKTVMARIVCKNIEPGRGGGGEYGTLGSIPGLVE